MHIDITTLRHEPAYIITTHTYEKLIHKISITLHRYMTKQKGKYILRRSCYDKTAWVHCLRTTNHRSAQKHMEIDKTKEIWKWNKIQLRWNSNLMQQQ